MASASRPIWAAACAGALLAGGPAAASTYTQFLTFETAERQSAWGTGAAARVAGDQFLGTTWNVSSPTLGGIVGSRTEVTTNLLLPAWEVCEAIPFNPISCGSRPEPTTTVIDTRTGATGSVSTSGRLGTQLDWALDAGSVGASLAFRPELDLPDPVEIGATVVLNPRAVRTGGALDAQSPTVEASLDTVFEAKVDAGGRLCVFGFGCANPSATLVDVNDQSELLSIDPSRLLIADGFTPDLLDLEVLIADVTVSFGAEITPAGGVRPVASANGISLTGPSAGVTVELANIEFAVPSVASSGTLQDDGSVKAGSSDQILAVNADVDALVPLIPVGGAGIGVGPFNLTLDAYDAKVGPTMSLFQDFTLTSTLMADLAFDRPVEIGGTLYDSLFTTAWDKLPALRIFEDTLFTPTFWLDAVLESKTGLAFGLDLTLDFLKGNLSLGPLQASLGPLVSLSLFETEFGRVNVFDDSFALGGFEALRGDSFMLSVLREPDAPAVIPVPPAFALLASALGLLGLLRRRRVIRA